MASTNAQPSSASAATRYTGIIIEGRRAGGGLAPTRGRLCGRGFCGAGIIRRGWSGLRHLSRIVLVADARRRESWLAAGCQRQAGSPGVPSRVALCGRLA
jgi:hypothetical protein